MLSAHLLLDYSSTLKMKARRSSEKSTVNGIISQNIEVFIITAMRTSDPAYHYCLASCN
jgi:hypothetical protein